MRQSTNASPWVSDACQPIFRYGGSTVKPGVPAGTRKAEISCGRRHRRHRDHRRDRRARVGDEGLLAVEHPLVRGVVELGLRAGPAGVAAGVGLGQPEGPEGPAGAQIRQPALALGLGAELVDGIGAEADPGFEGDGERLVDPRDLLDGDAEPGEVTARAVRLGERDAEQPEVAHGSYRLQRQLPGLFPPDDVRLQLLRGEVANDGPQRLVLLRHMRVHANSLQLSSGWAPSSSPRTDRATRSAAFAAGTPA